MSSMTDYTEEKFLKHAVGNTAWTAPAATYLAIHTGDPGEAGSSSEASGGSYARQAITWVYNSPRVENDGALTFASMPAGTFSHFSVCDALTGGNRLFKGSFTTPQTLTAGQSLIVADGDLRITAD